MADTRDQALERLETDIEQARDKPEAMTYLVEHLAEWGPQHFDVQMIAERVMAMGEGD